MPHFRSVSRWNITSCDDYSQANSPAYTGRAQSRTDKRDWPIEVHAKCTADGQSG
jgi:hypothetical protein